MIWGGADLVIIEIKCTIIVMHLNNPETIPLPTVRRKIVFHETCPWCRARRLGTVGVNNTSSATKDWNHPLVWNKQIHRWFLWYFLHLLKCYTKNHGNTYSSKRVKHSILIHLQELLRLLKRLKHSVILEHRGSRTTGLRDLSNEGGKCHLSWTVHRAPKNPLSSS